MCIGNIIATHKKKEFGCMLTRNKFKHWVDEEVRMVFTTNCNPKKCYNVYYSHFKNIILAHILRISGKI